MEYSDQQNYENYYDDYLINQEAYCFYEDYELGIINKLGNKGVFILESWMYYIYDYCITPDIFYSGEVISECLKTKIIFDKGKISCTTGPAIIHEDGKVEYAILGKFYSKEQWFDNLSLEQKLQILMNVDF